MSELRLSVSPGREERQMAQESFQILTDILEEINYPENVPEISVMETGRSIKISFDVLKMLAEILRNLKNGHSVSLISQSAVFTTQKAAEFLNCSRPHVIKLIDEGKLEVEMVGRHRRIPLNTLLDFKKKMFQDRKMALIKLMRDSEDLGLYEVD